MQDPLNTSGEQYKSENGQYLPQYPNEGDRLRPLTHDEMDYNLDLVGQVIKGYRVMGTGTDGDLDLINDLDKF